MEWVDTITRNTSLGKIRQDEEARLRQTFVHFERPKAKDYSRIKSVPVEPRPLENGSELFRLACVKVYGVFVTVLTWQDGGFVPSEQLLRYGAKADVEPFFDRKAESDPSMRFVFLRDEVPAEFVADDPMLNVATAKRVGHAKPKPEPKAFVPPARVADTPRFYMWPSRVPVY
jgi:hypothetical protein